MLTDKKESGRKVASLVYLEASWKSIVQAVVVDRRNFSLSGNPARSARNCAILWAENCPWWFYNTLNSAAYFPRYTYVTPCYSKYFSYLKRYNS